MLESWKDPSRRESIQMVVNSRMAGWFKISSRLIRAISWAEVRCPGAGRPVQLQKVVSDMPSSTALAFIFSTKALSLPARCSARATLASLPEATATALRRSWTLMTSPSFR